MFRVRLLGVGAFAVTLLLLARISGALAALIGASTDSVFLAAGFFVFGAVIGGISFSVVAGLLGSLGRGIVNDLK